MLTNLKSRNNMNCAEFSATTTTKKQEIMPECGMVDDRMELQNYANGQLSNYSTVRQYDRTNL